MSTKTKAALHGARSAMNTEIEKLDQKLIEVAVKTEVEPTHSDKLTQWGVQIRAASIRMTQQVGLIRKRAERAKRAAGATSIIEAIIEDQNNSK